MMINFQDHIIAILMRCCRREPTGIARCIALSSIAMFVYKELSYKSLHRTIPEAVNVLLLSLKVRYNRRLQFWFGLNVNLNNMYIIIKHVETELRKVCETA